MWQQEQDAACPGCHQPRDEVWVWSPEEQKEKQAEWSGHLRLCVACEARDQASARHRQADKPYLHGMYPVSERSVVPDHPGT